MSMPLAIPMHQSIYVDPRRAPPDQGICDMDHFGCQNRQLWVNLLPSENYVSLYFWHHKWMLNSYNWYQYFHQFPFSLGRSDLEIFALFLFVRRWTFCTISFCEKLNFLHYFKWCHNVSCCQHMTITSNWYGDGHSDKTWLCNLAVHTR